MDPLTLTLVFGGLVVVVGVGLVIAWAMRQTGGAPSWWGGTHAPVDPSGLSGMMVHPSAFRRRPDVGLVDAIANAIEAYVPEPDERYRAAEQAAIAAIDWHRSNR